MRRQAERAAHLGELPLPQVVHGVYPLDQAVQAREQVESKHSRGKVVIRI